MKKVLFLTGDFTEDYETMVPFQMLEMVGYTVHTTLRATRPTLKSQAIILP